MRITTVQELTDCLAAGKYSRVGSYPLFFIAADGEPLSYDAVQENLEQVKEAITQASTVQRLPEDYRQWQVIAHEVNWENPQLYCKHTGQRIESAYAESTHP